MVSEFVRHHDLDIVCFQEPHEYQTKEIAARIPGSLSFIILPLSISLIHHSESSLLC
jgi:hypothetical protein